MNRRYTDLLLFVLSLLPILTTTDLRGQLLLHGSIAAAAAGSGNGQSQYVLNSGHPTFLWRGDLMIDGAVSENVIIRANARIEQDQVLRVDLLSVSFMNIVEDQLHIDAGLIDVPFLNLGAGRYPRTNPFPGLPLMNAHHLAPIAPDPSYPETVMEWPQLENEGPHFLDNGLYDLGTKVFGSCASLDYALAVINGAVGQTSAYTPDGLNPDGSFGVAGRLGCTPVPELTFGISAAHGSLISTYVAADSLSGGYNSRGASLPQSAAGLDARFSSGHFTAYGQCMYSNIERSPGSRLEAFAYSIEASYVPAPRFRMAARAGEIIFARPTGYSLRAGSRLYENRFDFDVLRIEGSVGYRITRESEVRFAYQRTVTLQIGQDPQDDLAVMQIVTSF